MPCSCFDGAEPDSTGTYDLYFPNHIVKSSLAGNIRAIPVVKLPESVKRSGNADIPSLRRTAEEISLNIAYRWFLGYSLTDKTPHFSTFSYNFSHRFTEEVVQQIFNWILNEINDAGYLSPEAVFIDGTHIKARTIDILRSSASFTTAARKQLSVFLLTQKKNIQ